MFGFFKLSIAPTFSSFGLIHEFHGLASLFVSERIRISFYLPNIGFFRVRRIVSVHFRVCFRLLPLLCRLSKPV